MIKSKYFRKHFIWKVKFFELASEELFRYFEQLIWYKNFEKGNQTSKRTLKLVSLLKCSNTLKYSSNTYFWSYQWMPMFTRNKYLCNNCSVLPVHNWSACQFITYYVILMLKGAKQSLGWLHDKIWFMFELFEFNNFLWCPEGDKWFNWQKCHCLDIVMK